MSVRLPKELPELAGIEEFVIEQLVAGVSFRKLSEYLNYLVSYWSLRETGIVVHEFQRASANDLHTTETNYIEIETHSLTELLFVALGYSDVDQDTGTIEVLVNAAPAEDGSGHATPGSGASLDLGCKWEAIAGALPLSPDVNVQGLHWAHTGLTRPV